MCQPEIPLYRQPALPPHTSSTGYSHLWQPIIQAPKRAAGTTKPALLRDTCCVRLVLLRIIWYHTTLLAFSVMNKSIQLLSFSTTIDKLAVPLVVVFDVYARFVCCVPVCGPTRSTEHIPEQHTRPRPTICLLIIPLCNIRSNYICCCPYIFVLFCLFPVPSFFQRQTLETTRSYWMFRWRCILDDGR